MKAKYWALLVVAIIIVIGAYTMMRPQTPATGPLTYSWQFSEAGERENIPYTRATLVAGGRSYDLGEYQGSCSQMDTDFLEYQKSRVVCWYAGGGHELGVFEEPGQVVVRVGDVDEGASGTEGFRGNFRLLETIR